MSIAEPFVPFIAAATGGPAGRPKAAAKPTENSGFVPSVPTPSAASATPPFAPTSAAATPPPAPAPAASAATASATGPKEPHVAHGKPVVTLQRDGDQVTRIRVQCGCGETIDLDCVY